ncbi:hypothetical protein ACG83_41250 [Frankia sp. R43]|uniref:hypothetical protein n=1 Tax=Frankia sp. R43 TaxID=269536 RepID=UPI0006C9EF64|nr:hypothetical protein [Frankia sp. R43]KPM50249.1 hypothetical protein ACG83_41250 [Frankia sp. R43]
MEHDRELPDLMRSLPIDQRRGLPIPASTARFPDGTPKFSLVDGREALRLAAEDLCGICGNPLDPFVAFLGESKPVVAQVYHDPPMHESCAEASTRLCPHLTRRDMRRKAGRLSADVLPVDSAEERPDRWVMWICRGFTAYVIDGMPLFRPEPYQRLRTFTYGHDGRLHETPDTSPHP